MPPFRKLVATELSNKFRECTTIVRVDDVPAAGDADVVVRVHYAAINASDVNFTAGKYQPGVRPPFDVGFEAAGCVVAVGAAVHDGSVRGAPRVRVGDLVVLSEYGCFAEYVRASVRSVLLVVALRPDAAVRSLAAYLPLAVSALTASMALEQSAGLHVPALWPPSSPEAAAPAGAFVGRPAAAQRRAPVVVVTAAAGGTGVFAVQLARLAGARVIGVAGSDAKCRWLRDELGCAAAVSHRLDDAAFARALRDAVGRDGADVVYESVGGRVYDACLRVLGAHGRLVVIGMVSGYRSGDAWDAQPSAALATKVPLNAHLLQRSASVTGFFLPHFQRDRALNARHRDALLRLVADGRLRSIVDDEGCAHFAGLESVADAVDHMYTGKNIGKVYVRLATQATIDDDVARSQKTRM